MIKRKILFYSVIILSFLLIGGGIGAWRFQQRRTAFTPVTAPPVYVPPDTLSPFQRAVLNNLETQKNSPIQYDAGYFEGGKPPADKGVCTDVVIRSYDAAGVDLAKEVNEDIQKNMKDYPISKPDPNIDHRRCRNLAMFFQHYATSLPVDGGRDNWKPGDVIFLDTDNKGVATHVAVIGNGMDFEGNPTLIHHWPYLPVSETDGLHRYPILGHYRWVSN